MKKTALTVSAFLALTGCGSIAHRDNSDYRDPAIRMSDQQEIGSVSAVSGSGALQENIPASSINRSARSGKADQVEAIRATSSNSRMSPPVIEGIRITVGQENPNGPHSIKTETCEK